jgi:hypothetical protein
MTRIQSVLISVLKLFGIEVRKAVPAVSHNPKRTKGWPNPGRPFDTPNF